jgi:hypothetical protein
MATTKKTNPRKPATKKSKAQKAPKIYVFRCRNAGVHVGELGSYSSVSHMPVGTVCARNSRRLWQWTSKATLSELATLGPILSGANKYGCVLPELYLNGDDICEIIPCTPEAAAAIMAVPVWQARES